MQEVGVERGEVILMLEINVCYISNNYRLLTFQGTEVQIP